MRTASCPSSRSISCSGARKRKNDASQKGGVSETALVLFLKACLELTVIRILHTISARHGIVSYQGKILSLFFERFFDENPVIPSRRIAQTPPAGSSLGLRPRIGCRLQ